MQRLRAHRTRRRGSSRRSSRWRGHCAATPPARWPRNRRRSRCAAPRLERGDGPGADVAAHVEHARAGDSSAAGARDWRPGRRTSRSSGPRASGATKRQALLAHGHFGRRGSLAVGADADVLCQTFQLARAGVVLPDHSRRRRPPCAPPLRLRPRSPPCPPWRSAPTTTSP